MSIDLETRTYQYVNDLWNDEEAERLSPLDRLVYRSNCLGRDQRVTNTGGGNTSSKLTEIDPVTGAETEVLWVKGSGGDLRTSKRDNFSSLYQDKLLALQKVYAGRRDRGPKTPAEDGMVELFNHTVFNLNRRAPSIDTPLHSFVPYRFVDHTHPNAPIALAACARSAELTREIYGDSIVHLPWLRPGFELGLQMQQVCREHPNAVGIIMGQHGLINWANNDRECYYLTLDLIEKASAYIEKKYQEKGGHATAFGGQKHKSFGASTRDAILVGLLPWLRGQLSGDKRMIATVQSDDTVLRFVNSNDAPRLAELGTSCPDHFLRTKIKPLYLPLDAISKDLTSEAEITAFVADLKVRLTAALAAYRADYKAYYDACKRPNSPAMRDPNPTVVLIPGVGMIAWGKSKSESRVTAEFYNCAVEVMRGAEAIDRYIALPKQEAFDIEYWLLEEAKLQRMPPEHELARQICVVIGAGSGIGKEVVSRLIREGAVIVSVDMNEAAAQETAREISAKVGLGIGVAGTGISGCGDCVGLPADITNRESVRAMLRQAILAYGGVDHVVVTAGIFVPPDRSGRVADEKWALTFAINVTGSYIVADEAASVWKEQGLRGSLVLTTSANAVVAKKGSLAYDTSKAAANHLVRELSMELGPLVRVNGVAPATVVEGSSMFPRDRVISSLVKYSIPFEESDSTEVLRTRLARFYADRTITKDPITPADQAEAFFLLVSNRLSKTTGQVVHVDGGLDNAFLR
jgi:rhamnulose-1-phosphate aldolase/alcohol dehydrogenase